MADNFDRIGGRARVFVGSQEVPVEDAFIDNHDVEREARPSLNNIEGYTERVKAPGCRFTMIITPDYDPDYWRSLFDVDVTIVSPFKDRPRRYEFAQCFRTDVNEEDVVGGTIEVVFMCRNAPVIVNI